MHMFKFKSFGIVIANIRYTEEFDHLGVHGSCLGVRSYLDEPCCLFHTDVIQSHTEKQLIHIHYKRIKEDICFMNGQM